MLLSYIFLGLPSYFSAKFPCQNSVRASYFPHSYFVLAITLLVCVTEVTGSDLGRASATLTGAHRSCPQCLMGDISTVSQN